MKSGKARYNKRKVEIKTGEGRHDKDPFNSQQKALHPKKVTRAKSQIKLRG